MKQKVVVGMSGGVDSSVAALLLKNSGYDVIGVTMILYEKDIIDDAKAVCEKLSIPYYTLDLRNEFKKYVIDNFANEYIKGNTPNPCILCNTFLKFGLMQKKAKEMFDADYIATGHYAKVLKDNISNRYYLSESDSTNKDQTYVLYSLSQEQLSHIIMPLGSYTKDEVRKIAKENNLINAEKKDSQEICFVEKNDYATFIEKEYNYTPVLGDFVDTKGKKYGKHKGIIHYTVGQRRGLGLSLKSPLYVKKIDVDNNNVILCPKDELYSESLICKNVNFMKIDKLINPISCLVKIRYSANKVKATLIPIDNDKIKVVFDKPEKAITPGQSAVFYDDMDIIGGGIII